MRALVDLILGSAVIVAILIPTLIALRQRSRAKQLRALEFRLALEREQRRHAVAALRVVLQTSDDPQSRNDAAIALDQISLLREKLETQEINQ